MDFGFILTNPDTAPQSTDLIIRHHRAKTNIRVLTRTEHDTEVGIIKEEEEDESSAGSDLTEVEP